MDTFYQSEKRQNYLLYILYKLKDVSIKWEQVNRRCDGGQWII